MPPVPGRMTAVRGTDSGMVASAFLVVASRRMVPVTASLSAPSARARAPSTPAGAVGRIVMCWARGVNSWVTPLALVRESLRAPCVTGTVARNVSMRDSRRDTCRSRFCCWDRTCSRRCSAAFASASARTWVSRNGSVSRVSRARVSPSSWCCAPASCSRVRVSATSSSWRVISSSSAVTWARWDSSCASSRTIPSRRSANARTWARCSLSAWSAASWRMATSSRILSRRSAAISTWVASS